MRAVQRYLRSAGTVGFLILSTACLCACVSAIKIGRSEKAAIKDYRDVHFIGSVYFIGSKEDPHGVNPKAVKRFEDMGLKVTVVEPDKPLEGAHGTGFLISRDGHLLTCAHVLGEGREATIWIAGSRHEADVVGVDQEKDIAVLKLRNTNGSAFAPVSFRGETRDSIGEDVSTIGFPISNLLGSSASFSRGSLSATSGITDNSNHFQVSAEVQPGSSGGPLVDKQGIVLGMVNQNLNPCESLGRPAAHCPRTLRSRAM